MAKKPRPGHGARYECPHGCGFHDYQRPGVDVGHWCKKKNNQHRALKEATA